MWNRKSMTAVALCGCLAPAWLLAADNGGEERRISVGLRLNGYLSDLFKTGTAQASTSKPVADYTFTGSVGTGGSAVGPAVEYRFSKRLSLIGEMRVREAKYVQTTEIRNGRKDPAATGDTRNIDTITEATTANYWEFPVLAQYSRGIYYLVGGLQLRRVGQVRTGTEFSYADGSTDYNEDPALKARSNQVGVVFGVGFLAVDSRRVKVKPEIRYVRWGGTVFQGPSYRSASSQVEAGIGFMF
jgi:hypothetical protein